MTHDREAGDVRSPNDPFGDLLRRCEREGYDCRVATMRDGVRVMLIADGRNKRRVELLSDLVDTARDT